MRCALVGIHYLMHRTMYYECKVRIIVYVLCMPSTVQQSRHPIAISRSIFIIVICTM